MNLSIVLSTQPAQFQAATFKGDLNDNLTRISSLGYDGVELAIRDPKIIDFPQLSELISKHNLRVPAIGTGQAWGEEGLSFTDPDPVIRAAAIERIKTHVPLAKHFNAIIIIGLVRGIIKPGVTQEQGYSWLVEALQECSLAAEPHGVRLALEPINRYETSLINNADQGLTLIEAVGAENFGLLLDTFHMNIEDASIEGSIKLCGNRIFHFHVADSNRLYPGGGHIDFKSILKTLTENGYTGYVSGEFLPDPDPLTAAQKSIQFLRGLKI